MSFPDAPHLFHLQRDLWQWPRARAAVMVGAGFSLNAESLPGVRSRFLTWRELVREMFDQIHPLPSGAPPSEVAAHTDKFNRASPLRIASEYEAAFDRHKLDTLIREFNPDADYRPAKLHDLLLRLPWADVFTTNYDTLLERTHVVGRSYQPVTKAAELVTAFAPRIIKLHGSLPSQTPFIISEEDYRTYPRQFAPFVNSVRQSLLENCFVLLGFSGDDPNFLEWTGWIRDELGDRHAPIYLVGALSLGNADRLLLGRRGVTPIDLAPLVSSRTAVDRHAVAIEWFLEALRSARPDRPDEWPVTDRPASKSIAGLPPISSPFDSEPPKIKRRAFNDPIDAPALRAIGARWKFERRSYPGWVVAPDSIRSGIWRETEDWIMPLIQNKVGLGSADLIVLFGEICWRFELCLAPLLSDMIGPFDKAIDDCLEALVNDAAPKIDVAVLDVSRSDLPAAWLTVAMALLGDARESYNNARWKSIKSKVDRVTERNRSFFDRVQYECALYQIWNVDRAEARRALSLWEPTARSPLSMIWKAGLLAELDELGDSRSLLRAALWEIRQAQRHQGENIELLSLEGWCSYVLYSVESCLDFTRGIAVREEFAERWHELKAWDCSPWPLKTFFHSALSSYPPTQKQSAEEIRGFDPGHTSITRHFGGTGIRDFLPAFGYIRLFERAGIPMRMPHYDIAGDSLRNACRWIGPMTEFWSPALLIRAGKHEDIKKEKFLTRPQVALLDATLANRLHEWCLRILESEIKHFSGFAQMGSATEAMFEVVPEVLSRLAFRLSPEDMNRDFQVALRLNRLPAIRAHHSLHDCCDDWFKRLFEAADGALLLKWLPELIRCPLFDEGVNQILPPGSVWPDPMRHFPPHRSREAIESSANANESINAATNWLLKRAESEAGEARHRAMVRLNDVYFADLMGPKEKETLGRLLWEKRGPNNLPDMPGWSSLGFLHLPAPADVDVTAAIKASILKAPATVVTGTGENNQATLTQRWPEHPVIREAALVSRPVVQVPGEALGTVEWTEPEAESLHGVLVQWWEHDRKGLKAFHRRGGGFGLMGTESITDTLKRSADFLIRVVMPQARHWTAQQWEKFSEFITEARTYETYLSKVLPYTLIHRPESIESVARILSDDLQSNIADAAYAAAKAIRHWQYLADAQLVPPVSEHVKQLLTERIAFRRKAGIAGCLSQMAALVREKPTRISSTNALLLINCLAAWHESTALTVSISDETEIALEERPDLRAMLGTLAASLNTWLATQRPGEPEPATIAFWRTDCAASPLPEVRRAFRD